MLCTRKLFTTHFNYKNEIGKYAYIDQCIGEAYLKLNMFDSALIYTRQSLSEKGPDPGDELYSTRILGDIHFARENYETALNYYRKYADGYIKYNNPPFIGYKQNRRDLGFVFNSIAKIFQKTGQNDSSFFYAKKALENALAYQDQENIFNAATVLYDFYKKNNEYDAFKYYKTATAAKDSMASIEKLKQIQMLTFNEQMREKQQAEADAKAAAKIRLIITIVAVIVLILSFLIWNRIRQLRLKYKVILEQKEAEKLKAKYEKELLELEAKALRAQMNPHFIFNCLNSIKALMQEKDTDKGVIYLTTFSKLIRTLFNNADKKEITLYDEIETCKLYLQLEAMRFNNKLSYSVNIDENIDLKSIYVPALIIQPFIENAIWHGIVPKESDGMVLLSVEKENSAVKIVVEDNGIGREASQQNKPASSITHQSKGVNLTQSRLELDNLLKQRKAKLEFMDKKDESGKATGTKVIITIKEEI